MQELEPIEAQYPAIPGLTDLQSAFVHEMLTDASSHTAAAIRAGYSERSAHVLASRMMRNPLICKAIMEGSAMLLAGHAAEAVQTKLAVMRQVKNTRERNAAAGDILDRVGLMAPQQRKVSGSLSISIDLGDDG
jgi:phage terminase small subunit